MSRVYSDRELLELFRMLLRMQIREERINSYSELEALLTHVEEALAGPAVVGLTDEMVVYAAARAIYDRVHRKGAWDNPGTLPDEINRGLWIEAAANGLRAAKDAKE